MEIYWKKAVVIFVGNNPFVRAIKIPKDNSFVFFVQGTDDGRNSLTYISISSFIGGAREGST